MPRDVEIESARLTAEQDFGLFPLKSVKKVSGGRVNATYLVESDQGRFILQKLHPVFGTDGRVVSNSAETAKAMAVHGLPAPLVRPTGNGALWSDNGGIWRLTIWLPGVMNETRSPESAAEAARILGAFHRAMNSYRPVLATPPDAEFSRDPVNGFADWSALNQAFQDSPKYPRANPLIRGGLRLAQAIPVIRAETRAFLHGDPKLENYLFDESGRALTLIDLDTVREGWLIWELADALRSWSAIRTRDLRMHFREEIFRAGWASYQRHGLELSAEELSLAPAAAGAAALNLARRYLDDYFRESYFSWDRDNYPSLAEQNFFRAEQYLSLAEAMLKKNGELV